MPTLQTPTYHDHREIGDASVSKFVAWASVVGFLLLIVSQLAATASNGSLLTSVGAWWTSSMEAVAGDTTEQTRSRNTRLHDAGERLEEDLTEASWLRQAVRAWGQLALTRLGGVGNTQVYLGHAADDDEGRWLYFAPATEHVLAPPFLDPGVQQRRAKNASAWEARPKTDPLAAIRLLANDLRTRNIHLIIVPAPSKVSLEMQQLTGRETTEPVLNQSYAPFLDALDEEGIPVVDPLRILGGLPAGERFLRQDSHWSPAAVDAVARGLAGRIRELSPDLAVGSSYRRRRLTVDHGGDLVDLLGLPSGHEPGNQRVEAEPVFDRNRPWQPDRSAQVLLLGDSFSNVFSQESLGWGAGAGLAEQLSYHLRAPVDKVVINAGGAHTAREAWVRDLGNGDRNLESLKVVVYEFAARELSWGDWQLIPLLER